MVWLDLTSPTDMSCIAHPWRPRLFARYSFSWTDSPSTISPSVSRRFSVTAFLDPTRRNLW